VAMTITMTINIAHEYDLAHHLAFTARLDTKTVLHPTDAALCKITCLQNG